MIHRRTFLAGMFSAMAAPAIVRAASLMPVKPIDDWREAVRFLQTIPTPPIADIIIYGSDMVPISFSGFDPFRSMREGHEQW